MKRNQTLSALAEEGSRSIESTLSPIKYSTAGGAILLEYADFSVC